MYAKQHFTANCHLHLHFVTYLSNSAVSHPTRLQVLILMFGGFLPLKICNLLEYREIIITAVFRIMG
jgi:hypothetical protein